MTLAARQNPDDIGLKGILMGLTAATGLIDAICYLGMGHVLVANMTGNVVFLGFALAGAPGFSIASFLVALASFLVGATIGGRLGESMHGDRRVWLTSASSIQAGLATIAALATVSGLLGPTGSHRFWVIGLLGAGTGVQNATVRRLGLTDFTTTVLTITLTGLAADSSLAGGTNPRHLRRIGSVVAMLVGALIGGALMVHAGFTTALVVLAAFLCVVTLGFAAVGGETPVAGALSS
jgi:uncharacterized membrane protein YoaK (UPF0700 family)